MYRENLSNTILEIQRKIELTVYLDEILTAIRLGHYQSKVLDEIFSRYDINESIAKIDFINAIFEYIKFLLEEHKLTEDVKEGIRYLKLALHILPGEIYFHKQDDVERLIRYQLTKIYEDGLVSGDEAILKIELQELFDLNFDQ